MECNKCKEEFKEEELEISHDVPKYMFPENKNEADNWNRRFLCKKCHIIYEKIIPSIIIKNLDKETIIKLRYKIKQFAEYYFKKGENGRLQF